MMLYKLMRWVKHSINWHMFGKCGDPIKNWQLALYADSDFAGCIFTKKSTTGAILVIVADNTWLPVGVIQQARIDRDIDTECRAYRSRQRDSTAWHTTTCGARKNH